MNRLVKYIIILVGVLIIAPNQLLAQKVIRNDSYSQDVFFWFNVKLYKTVDRNTKADSYTMRLVTPTIYNGKIKDFQRALWSGTVAGTKIAVGPFPTREEASNALEFYKRIKDTTYSPDLKNEHYWFLVKVNILERSRSYEFERMASRVASGKVAEFNAVLHESLGFKTLAIGPFGDGLIAEQAKQIYRIEE